MSIRNNKSRNCFTFLWHLICTRSDEPLDDCNKFISRFFSAQKSGRIFKKIQWISFWTQKWVHHVMLHAITLSAQHDVPHSGFKMILTYRCGQTRSKNSPIHLTPPLHCWTSHRASSTTLTSNANSSFLLA